MTTSITNTQGYNNLRALLPAIFQGPNFSALLSGIAVGDDLGLQNSTAVFQNSFVSTASGEQLDILLGSRGFNRPDLIGISDDSYRELWIKAYNFSNLTLGIENALQIGYLPVYTNASVLSGLSEPYDISGGGQLFFNVDGVFSTITLEPLNFNNSVSASAQEVAMEISSLCESGNINAYAEDFFDEGTNTTKIRLFSQTAGPSGSMQVSGGQAQNYLQFNTAITNTSDTTTQYTISGTGNIVTWEWTGGTKPPLSGLIPGYYVNIYGTEFNSLNNGSFTITNVVNSSLTDGSGFFQYKSDLFYNQSVTQTSLTSVLFYNPVKERIMDQLSFATISQIAPNSSTVYMPASTDMLDRAPTTGGSFLTDTIYTINHSSGSFIENESIIGTTSLASGFILSSSSLSCTVELITNQTFTAGEIITGQQSQVNCTITSIASSFNLNVTGPFLFDSTQPEIVNFSLTLGQTIFPNQSLTAIVVSSTDNVSQTGYIYVGASLDTYEGPIAYNLAVGDLLVTNPTYIYQYYHAPGELLDLTLVKTPTDILDIDGVVSAAIMSDVANARNFLQNVIQFIYPTGIKLDFNILYPLIGSFITLENIEYIYGGDDNATQDL